MKKISIKALFWILFVTLAAAPVTMAQNNSSKADSTEFKGFKKHALQFQVHELLDLSSFQDGLISYKFHFNDHNALRVGFGLRGDQIDYETDQIGQDNTTFTSPDEHQIAGDTLSSNSTTDESDMQLRFRSQYVRYFNPLEKIKIFAGIGPYVSYQKGEEVTNENIVRKALRIEEVTYRDSTWTTQHREIVDEQRERTSNHESFEFGLSAVFGVEWFINQHFSLSGEYSFHGGYEYFEDEYVTRGTVERNTLDDLPDRERNRTYRRNYENISNRDGSRWNYGYGDVRIGLSVYF